jgi:hypothetical protein
MAKASRYSHVWKDDVQPVSMHCAGVQTMIARCLHWLAGRPVTFPVPADFPTGDKTSIHPEFAIAQNQK